MKLSFISLISTHGATTPPTTCVPPAGEEPLRHDSRGDQGRRVLPAAPVRPGPGAADYRAY